MLHKWNQNVGTPDNHMNLMVRHGSRSPASGEYLVQIAMSFSYVVVPVCFGAQNPGPWSSNPLV